MPTWSALLREARRTRGLGQEELARRAQVSPRLIQGYERGTMRPSRDALLKLARTLELDRQTTNTLLVEAGFDPVPSGRLARFARRSLSFAAMQRAIDRYPWPCLVMSDSMEILLWNPPATWVAELDFASALPDPADRTLLRIATRRHFRERVQNWADVAAVMVGMLKADFADPERYAEAMPWFATLVQAVATDPESSEIFPELLALWERVAPREDIARTSFRADWRLADGTALAFNCLVASWNDFDAAGAFDWFPADGATATWLSTRAEAAGGHEEAQPDTPSSGQSFGDSGI